MNDNTWNRNWFASPEERKEYFQISLKYSIASALRFNASLEASLPFLVCYVVFILYLCISLILSQLKATLWRLCRQGRSKVNA